MRYFVKVAETGNITRAAESLGISQPSLGVQIKLLEEEVGASLLLRHSRGVSVTAAGSRFYQGARDVLQRIEGLAARARATPDGALSLTLGLPPSAMKMIGQSILSLASDRLEMTLIEERSFVLANALERQQADVAIAYNAPTDERYVRTPILEEELLFVTAPSYFPHLLSREDVSLSEVLDSRLAVSVGPGIVHNLLKAEAERLSRTLDLAFRARSTPSLKSALLKGDTASILSFGLISDEIEAGRLVARRIRNRPLFRTLYFVRSIRTPDLPEIDTLRRRIRTSLLEKLGPLAQPVE